MYRAQSKPNMAIKKSLIRAGRGICAWRAPWPKAARRVAALPVVVASAAGAGLKLRGTSRQHNREISVDAERNGVVSFFSAFYYFS